MTPAMFAVLLALTSGDRYGYAIIRQVEELTCSGIRLTPGTLYRSLQRMLAMDLIEEVADGSRVPLRDTDDTQSESFSHPVEGYRMGRRRVYRITKSGRDAVEGEAHRLRNLVDAALYVGIFDGVRGHEPSGPTAQIVVVSAPRAVAFYSAVFAAEELVRHHDSRGAVIHSELRIGRGRLLVHDDVAADVVAPSAGATTSVRLHLHVEDVDETYAYAMSLGAVGEQTPHDAFWGDRYAVLRDPFGHVWSIAAAWGT